MLYQKLFTSRRTKELRKDLSERGLLDKDIYAPEPDSRYKSLRTGTHETREKRYENRKVNSMIDRRVEIRDKALERLAERIEYKKNHPHDRYADNSLAMAAEAVSCNHNNPFPNMYPVDFCDDPTLEYRDVASPDLIEAGQRYNKPKHREQERLVNENDKLYNRNKALTVGLGIAGAAGLGYGGYKLYKHFKDKKNKYKDHKIDKDGNIIDKDGKVIGNINNLNTGQKKK